MTLRHHILREMGPRTVALSIAADVANINIRTLAGSPASAVDVVVRMESGIYVYSASSATPSLDTGTGWAAGSTILLVNFGGVVGAGNGGDAIKLRWAMSIDNTGGVIFGGGGQGAQGVETNPTISHVDGGGAGGGQGRVGGAHSANTGTDGSPGTASDGSFSAAGLGAAGGFDSFYGSRGGKGGDGGGWGQNGKPSTTNSDGDKNTAVGTAGRAVWLNGFAVTWIGGNNPSQVKGLVA